MITNLSIKQSNIENQFHLICDLKGKLNNAEEENAELKAKLDILIDEYVSMRSYGGCSKFTRQDCLEWLKNKSAK